MPLIKGHHDFEDQYTQIPNAWLRDPRLTFKAKGLLAMVMSHREGWSLSINSINDHFLESKDSIRSAVRELENFGYLRREQRSEDGRFVEIDYITSDPIPLTEEPLTEKPTPKKNIIKNNSFKNNERELFDEFWKEYPKKLDKKPAMRAFKSALTRATFEDLLAGAIRYATDPNLPEKRFQKNPATWLNADAWENGPLPSRGKKTEDLDSWAEQQDRLNDENR